MRMGVRSVHMDADAHVLMSRPPQPLLVRTSLTRLASPPVPPSASHGCRYVGCALACVDVAPSVVPLLARMWLCRLCPCLRGCRYVGCALACVDVAASVVPLLARMSLRRLCPCLRGCGCVGCALACVDVASSRYDAPRDRKPITAQIVIGTPGKLKNWVTKTRQLALKDIVILVFDEADEMMSQDGFADDSVRMLKEIQKATRNKTQILLFSATFSEQVKQFTLRNVPNANKVFVPVEQLSLDVIKQYNVFCPTPSDKSKVLRERIFPVCENLGQTIIFVRTREWARKLHQEMERDGHKCTSIEGGMSHADRDAVVNEFRKGTTKVLISTDVLARGFDQAQVTLVINYDVPLDRERRNPAFETYLHRIGRSGRFGRKGAAFNLICGQQEARFVQRIQEHFNIHIESVPPDDDDAFERVLKQAGLA
eukprot:jgi/Mesvir1/10530/Mv21769-RA.3